MLSEALAAYGLSNAEAVLLGHNENLTYRVAGRYVLRIHRTREGMSTAAFDGDADAISLRRTEMAFCGIWRRRGCMCSILCPICRVTT